MAFKIASKHGIVETLGAASTIMIGWHGTVAVSSKHIQKRKRSTGEAHNDTEGQLTGLMSRYNKYKVLKNARFEHEHEREVNK